MDTSRIPHSPRRTPARSLGAVAVGLVAVLLLGLPAAASARPAATAAGTSAAHGAAADRPQVGSARSTIGVDDYPYRTATKGDTGVWRFSIRYCTSFVAWRINDLLGKSDFANHRTDESYWAFKNFMATPAGGTVQFGNAYEWAAAAEAMGWTVDQTPTVGSIAQWGKGDTGGASNHVAVVKQVNADGSVWVEDYNWTGNGTYLVHQVRAPRYIHVPGISTDAAQLAGPSISPFASTAAFIDQQYVDFAGRGATTGEQSLWTSYLSSNSPGGLLEWMVDTNSQVLDVTAPVVRLYRAFFLRPPDPAGYQFWSQQLANGRSVAWVGDAFAGSQEFKITYGSLDNPSFVDLVYHNVLGRTADPAGRAMWIQKLQEGWTRGRVMAGFSESTEFKMQTDDANSITRLYLGMLRRSPDSGGLSSWLTYLHGDHTMADVADAIRRSAEYSARFPG
ncbi:MAG TPA: DUF4214 domain-containing protein [Acidimicrobiales bacterium]|nr:DUF4214 domain-containing protein [Acidimicrobiales bacterium]